MQSATPVIELHLIEHSGAPHASRPPRHLRSRGLPSWTGNRQLASSRSSTPPARFGRATDAPGPAHHGLGSSPIGGRPIGDAIRRIRRCTPCMFVITQAVTGRRLGKPLDGVGRYPGSDDPIAPAGSVAVPFCDCAPPAPSSSH